MDQSGISSASVKYGRTIQPEKYGERAIEVSLELREGTDVEGMMDQLESAVERRHISAQQKRDAMLQFYSALLRVNVPAEDSDEACKLMEVQVPFTTLEFRTAARAFGNLFDTGQATIRTGGKPSLPDGWLWWKDGKYAKPSDNFSLAPTGPEYVPVVSSESTGDETGQP